MLLDCLIIIRAQGENTVSYSSSAKLILRQLFCTAGGVQAKTGAIVECRNTIVGWVLVRKIGNCQKSLRRKSCLILNAPLPIQIWAKGDGKVANLAPNNKRHLQTKSRLAKQKNKAGYFLQHSIFIENFLEEQTNKKGMSHDIGCSLQLFTFLYKR